MCMDLTRLILCSCILLDMSKRYLNYIWLKFVHRVSLKSPLYTRQFDQFRALFEANKTHNYIPVG